MSAGPPDSRRALSSGLFASYSMGLASPLDIRARRKIIVRTDVEIIWAPIYRKDWTRATQWTDLSIRLPPFCGASRATGSSLGRRNLCPGRPPRKHCWTTKVSVCQFSIKQNHLKLQHIAVLYFSVPGYLGQIQMAITQNQILITEIIHLGDQLLKPRTGRANKVKKSDSLVCSEF